MRKSKKRKPDFRRIRPTKTYSAPDIAEALNRNIATVRRWLGDGLPTLGSQRPPLVLGSELKAWLKAKWAARKQTCGPDELFCFRCRGPRRPKPNSVLIIQRNAKTVTVKAECIVCGALMNKAGSLKKLAEIEATFPTPTPQMQRLDRCRDDGVRRTSKRDGIDEADDCTGLDQIAMDI